ncbi:nitrilase-related carbon-nitrogen hydrolase [Clostridium sp. OS1-26]|uniref:carbon-nitrogen hydrolase family protein n=1 Tax=Clostridium sp. OS1-26 TaxID=3070681 RepID=UPI0027E0E718|nr:nitrilase-related carbon-nitrogen hydrolase [Clostridium sp. OS1-26]WML34412.1 nitrilase-related carbon-nitrogen hydrolase [Clostridium sp. OS1-26]
MRKMNTKVAVGQIQVLPTIQENLKKAAEMIAEAKAQGAEAILFPEIGFEPFFPKHPWDVKAFDSAEPIPGPISEFLGREAKKNEIVVVASYMEEGYTGEYYDSCIVIEKDGALLGTQRMVHTQEVGDFNEKFYYGNGNTAYPVFNTSVGRIGIAICYDAWFPEVCRSLALRGADMIMVPTAEKYCDGLPETDFPGGTIVECVTTMLRANAIHNGCWVVMCNRVGDEEGRYYFGTSSFINPWGQVIAQANNKSDQVLVNDIDYNLCRQIRQLWPMLRDRRVETYEMMTKWYGSTPYYDYDKVNI